MVDESHMDKGLAAARGGNRQGILEREVLRVVVTLQTPDAANAFEQARKEILVWTQKRSGGSLPAEAWQGEAFEHLAGGRPILAVSLETDEGVVWAIRADEPDKGVPGRVWTTEVTIGRPKDQAPQLSVRLKASSPEAGMNISPHVPGFLHQIYKALHVTVGGVTTQPHPKYVHSDEDGLEELISLLQRPERRIPVIVASGDERASNPASPLIDADSLARATFGLAHVFVLPAKYSYALSDAFGRARSVFHGGVRAYLSGFDSFADPYEHRLYLGQVVSRDPKACETELRRLTARESLRGTRLGDDVVVFATVCSAAARLEQNKTADASDADRLVAAQRHIEALEEEVKAAKIAIDESLDFAAAEDERAKFAEAQQYVLLGRVQLLEDALQKKGIEPDADSVLPESWVEFTDWCGKTLAGRLALTSQARRCIKKADFESPTLAAECLLWLASTCRQHRISGGRVLANISIQPGIENAPCGSDTFEFDWQEGRLSADWHVKNGGNTREPRRCLRIYYGFDEATRQIVVADMPAHRRSGAT